MHETVTRRMARIARSLFIDLVSTRIARRMLPGLLRVADETGPVTWLDYSKQSVTGKFEIGGIPFGVANAKFECLLEDSNHSIMFMWQHRIQR